MGRPNASDLAMRDPALAALMGALPGQNFGADPLDGGNAPFGADFGGYHHHHHAAMGADFGFGLAPQLAFHPQLLFPPSPAPAPAPAPANLANAHPALVQAWQNQQISDAHTSSREGMLDPNRYSRTKVERYSFSMSAALVLGTAAAISTTLQPNTTIRPQRVIMNAPAPNFVTLTSLQIANVNVFVGGTEDAWTYSATAQGVVLDLPTLQPAYRATAGGNCTGYIPAGFAANFAYTFIITFQGPASIAGSAGV